MNPVGGLVILLGLLAIVIGLNGSQQKVADAIRHARPGGQPQAGAGTGGGPGSPTAPHPGGGFHLPKIPDIPLVPQGPVTGIPFSPVSYA